jgi:hypothetical protein
MDLVLQIANETTSDLIGGGLIALINDAIFPDVEMVTSSNFLRITMEIVGQVALNGFLVYQYTQFQKGRGLGNPITNYVILSGFALFALQNSLIGKYYSLVSYLKTQISSSVSSSSSTSTKKKNKDFSGPSTNQNNTPNIGNQIRTADNNHASVITNVQTSSDFVY